MTQETDKRQASVEPIDLELRYVSTAELAAELLRIRGAAAISITAFTDQHAKKRGNPIGDIFKLSTVQGMVNFHYDAGVLRRLAAEGKDESEFHRGETWHKPVVDSLGRLTPLCRHASQDRTELYLRFMLISNTRRKYLDSVGREVDATLADQFIRQRSTYANQGLDKPLVFLVYSLSSIVELAYSGVTYVHSAGDYYQRGFHAIDR